MDQARKAGLKVLLVLTDYFRDDAGGPLQYMELAGATIANNPTLTKAMFYTNTAAKTYFKEYVSAVSAPCAFPCREQTLARPFGCTTTSKHNKSF
jgi:hypothetical protein